MKEKSMKIMRVFVVIVGILITFSTSNGYGNLRNVRLIPDERITPISRAVLRQPVRCLKEGETCKIGEILAIFNPTREDAALRERPNQVAELLREGIKNLGDDRTNFRRAIVSVYTLPETANLPVARTQACGNLMIRITGISGSVNNGIAILNAWTAAGTTPPFNDATLYSIQPDGAAKPGQDSTSDQIKPTSISHATETIGRFTLSIPPSLPRVKVAVLDTGWLDLGIATTATSNVNVDLVAARNFLDLDNLIPPNLNVTDDLKLTSPGSGIEIYKDVGHGTAISSIIGSQDSTIGIAPNADIVPIKICNENGDCDEASAIYGTCYASSKDVLASVINMSFSGRVDPTSVPHGLQLAINDVSRAGSLVVVAGGNSRSESYVKNIPGAKSNDFFYPAMLSSGFDAKLHGPSGSGDMFLAIGSVFTNLDYAGFATTAPFIDISAPGSWLKVLGKNGKIYDSSNEYISGTSFSAAYVSGAAALALGKFGAMPPSQLAYHLIFTANTGNCKKSVDSTGIVSTTDCGAGMVDVPHVFLTPP
jgi:hypothetical protein